MAEDIAPALLSKVQKEFRARIEKDGVTKTAMLPFHQHKKFL